jgi:hypothetical protein
MLPGSPFLSECQALSVIWPGSPQLYQIPILWTSISFLEIGRSLTVPNQGSMVGGGWQPFFILPETAGWGRKCETGHCHGEAARSLLAKVWGNITCFHAVAAKRHSRTHNSQFGLFGPVLRATTSAVWMAAPVGNILDISSYYPSILPSTQTGPSMLFLFWFAILLFWLLWY